MPLVPQALRHRDYALLWGGQTVSLVGDGIYTVAIALEALRLSNHASTLAYVEAARLLPNVLLLLFAGALVDRLPRRLVVLGADAVRGFAVAAVAGLAAAHALSITELVVLSAAAGIGDAFFSPAYQAIIPEVLPTELLTQGNAFNSGSQTVGSLLFGPAFGGVLVAVGGPSLAFSLDAATFVASALCLVAMAHVPAPAPSGHSLAHDARQGFRWTMRQRWLWYSILGAGVANLAAGSPIAVTIPLLVRDVLHQGPAAYGLAFAATGVGGVSAAIVAGRLGPPKRPLAVAWTSWGMASVVLFALGAAPDVYVVAVAGAVVFFGLTYGNLTWEALTQRVVPARMLGRVSSVDWLFSLSLSPIGVLLAGVLATSIGVRNTIFLGAGLAALASLVMWIPGVRDPDRPGYKTVTLPEDLQTPDARGPVDAPP